MESSVLVRISEQPTVHGCHDAFRTPEKRWAIIHDKNMTAKAL